MMVKRSRDDSLSSSSDIESYEPDNPVVVKYVQIDQSKPSKQQAEVMRCLLPPHRQPVTFSTYDDYDTHYKKFHQNRCSECHKNLPTNHFLNLHIAEIHDPLNEARRARGDKTYVCFVEDCTKVCSTPQKRRMHLVDKHMFPKNYDFFIVNDGLGRRKSMLRPEFQHRRHISAAVKSVSIEHRSTQPNGFNAPQESGSKLNADQGTPFESSITESDGDGSGDEEENHEEHLCPMPPSSSKSSERVLTPTTSNVDDEMAVITKSMSALKFVPPSIRFGRGARGGLARR